MNIFKNKRRTITFTAFILILAIISLFFVFNPFNSPSPLDKSIKATFTYLGIVPTAPIDGLVVDLYDSVPAKIDTGTTDIDGIVTFAGLPDGTQACMDVGWRRSLPDGVSDLRRISP